MEQFIADLIWNNLVHTINNLNVNLIYAKISIFITYLTLFNIAIFSLIISLRKLRVLTFLLTSVKKCAYNILKLIR